METNAIPAAQPAVARTRRIRAIVYDSRRRAFLAQVNNRVQLGAMTIVLPGGDIGPEEGHVDAIRRHLAAQVGFGGALSSGDVRFVCARAYEMPAQPGMQQEIAEILFYRVDLPGLVPVNLQEETVVSLSWMSLSDMNRYLDTSDGGWMIQMGARDAIGMAIDPAKAHVEKDGSKEVGRQDGGVAPRSPLPYAA